MSVKEFQNCSGSSRSTPELLYTVFIFSFFFLQGRLGIHQLSVPGAPRIFLDAS